MKIAHVVSTFWPRLGGMGQVVYDECRALVKRGHAVGVITMRYPGMAKTETRAGFTIQRLTPLLRLGDGGIVGGWAEPLADVDLVHLHWPWYGSAHRVAAACRKLGKKYVVTYHMDAAPRGLFKRLVRVLYDLAWAKKILRGAERVFVVDKNYFGESRFVAAINLSRVIELPNAVDTEIFKPVSEQHSDKTFIFVGNLMPVKRLDLLLAAMREIPEARLVVVGGGYEEVRYKKMTTDYGLSRFCCGAKSRIRDSAEAESGQDTVQFVGKITDRHELAKYYSSALALVVPSDTESFSLVALEAMACGIPVIASDIAGLRARVIDGENGFLFTPGSVESLIEKMKQMLGLTKDERKKMGARGRQLVEDQFNLEKHIEKLVAVYQHVI